MHIKNSKLSILLIFQNERSLIQEYLDSLVGLNYSLLVLNNKSTDGTLILVNIIANTLIKSDKQNLGQLREELLSKAHTEWVLMLDSDERLSPELRDEILEILKHPKPDINGYSIPYRNHFWNRPLKQDAEQYSKVRLFRRTKGHISPALVHEEIKVDGKIGILRGNILHYSYRSVGQVFRKFTDYAKRAATEKYQMGERVTFRKLFMYGPHMFWARYAESKGYIDGLEGLLLSKLFAYMEQMTYMFLLYYSFIPPKRDTS